MNMIGNANVKKNAGRSRANMRRLARDHRPDAAEVHSRNSVPVASRKTSSSVGWRTDEAAHLDAASLGQGDQPEQRALRLDRGQLVGAVGARHALHALSAASASSLRPSPSKTTRERPCRPSISACGESSAMMRPPSMIATRSHSVSASSR